MTGLVCVACLRGLAALSAEPPPQEADDRGEADILVTGERVERRLLDSPSSVSVFQAERIEALAGVERLEDLLAHVPNVQIGSGGEGPTIRGQDSTGVLRDLPAFLGGTRPRTTLQVDGRAAGFSEFIFGAGPLWDVERVELFRSPQTTTQGRNSIAGAIFVETNDPTYAWESRGRLIAGNEDTRQGSAVVSGPIFPGSPRTRAPGARRARSPTSSPMPIPTRRITRSSGSSCWPSPGRCRACGWS